MIFQIDDEEDDENEEEEEERESVVQETDFKLDEFLQRCDRNRIIILDILTKSFICGIRN